MSNPRDIWSRYAPAVQTKKIRKNLTIPAFSANCGEPKSCIHLFTDNVDQGYVQHFMLAASSLTTALTVEAWVKLDRLPFHESDDAYGVIFERTNLATQYLWLAINAQGGLELLLRKGGIPTLFTSGLNKVPVGEWFFVCASWNGETVNLYINTKLVGSGDLAAPINDVSTRNYIGLGNHAAGAETHKQFSGRIDEIRVWSEGRTLNQVVASYKSPRNFTAADDVDDALEHYYKFQEGEGSVILDSATGETAAKTVSEDNFAWVTDDGFPLKYGASFIAKRFTIVSESRLSLNFPVAAPVESDHCLCVSWWDSIAMTTKRRKLYGSDTNLYDAENIWPTPELYNGEKLPLTFYLEFWNVDGRDSINLEDDLVIEVSKITEPTTSRDHTAVVETTPVGDINLGIEFPATNPLTPTAELTF